MEDFLNLDGSPLFSNLPTIGPLLACKHFHECGVQIFHSAFTGAMYVSSRLIWKEIHWRYEAVMARAEALYIHSKYVWCFNQLKLIDKLTRLKTMTILVIGLLPTQFLDFRLDDDLEESGIPGTSTEMTSEVRQMLNASPTSRVSLVQSDSVTLMAQQPALKTILACREAYEECRKRRVRVVWRMPLVADVEGASETWGTRRFCLITDFDLTDFDRTDTLADANILHHRLLLRSHKRQEAPLDHAGFPDPTL